MKNAHAPFSTRETRARERVIEAAPARARIRVLAFALAGAFVVVGGRVAQLALVGGPAPAQAATPSAAFLPRADLTDRNGALLAATIDGFTLTADPARVEDPAATLRALLRLFPDLDADDTLRRLTDTRVRTVYIRRSLHPRQRAEVRALALPGLGFEAQPLRVYPMGPLAGHVLGRVDPDLTPLAGVERGLDAEIRRAGAVGETLRLSLDVRIQFAVEDELARAARETGARGGAAVVLDGRSGETLAMASWPGVDPNHRGAIPDAAIANRAAARRYEMGSTMKSFTVAMALEEGLASPRERFTLAPFNVDGVEISDLHPFEGAATLRDIIAQSSNIGAARLALRTGPARQRAYFDRLGLLARADMEAPESARPIAPMRSDRLSVAVLGYGHGLSVSLAALADAYTVFANDGARVPLTLRARAAADAPRTRVFSPETARQVVAMMRAAVVRGTAQRADVPGLEIAGKTGSAEKLGDQGYEEGRLFSSFAAIFPASDPRYVIVLALDEPTRPPPGMGVVTGGAVAAPAVGRIAARIAPALGLRVEG
ncbi:MAG: penicillin-binding protein 2 [Alphaproteobacteria bacterium]|nr:penicillin-binding protein 2 [Alphaproteobacteria bacterium]